MPKITIIDTGESGEFESGKILLVCINAMQVKIGQVCGGDGACGTCRIEVVEGWENLTPQTPDETYKELEAPYRLSCQATLLGDVTFRIAKIE
jgi:ferredoxin, 2Fe-2S